MKDDENYRNYWSAFMVVVGSNSESSDSADEDGDDGP